MNSRDRKLVAVEITLAALVTLLFVLLAHDHIPAVYTWVRETLVGAVNSLSGS